MLLIRLLSLLPLGVLHVLSSVVLYPIVRYVVRYRRSVVEKNLAFAFAEKSDAERLQIEKNFYHHLCDVLVETIHLSRMTLNELQEHFFWDNYDELKAACLQSHRPALCLFAHYGNWEWAMARMEASENVKTMHFYSPLHNAPLHQWLTASRSRFGSKAVTSDSASAEIAQSLNDGSHFLIFAATDQLPKEQYVRHFHRFMGIKTKVLTGTEQLARKYNMDVYFCRVQRVRRGYYTCHAERLQPPLSDDSVAAYDKNSTHADRSQWPLTDAYFDRLQQMLHECPELWLWSHDRWRR